MLQELTKKRRLLINLTGHLRLMMILRTDIRNYLTALGKKKWIKSLILFIIMNIRLLLINQLYLKK